MFKALGMALLVAAGVQSGAIVRQGANPVGPIKPNSRPITPLDHLPTYTGDAIIPQQKPPIHSIRVVYNMGMRWQLTFDAGPVFTIWECAPYYPDGPGQPVKPQTCFGVPKAQTASLKIKLTGYGPNQGKTAAITGAQWGGDCAGTAGDACTLEMSANRNVTVSVPAP